MKRILISMFLTTALLAWFVFPSERASAVCRPEKSISIAVLPCNDPVVTFKTFHKLVIYLGRETSLETKLVVPRNHADFERAIKNGEIDFALQDPLTYLKWAGKYNTESLISALTPDGTTTQRALLIARKDAGIEKIEDLRGKKVMFGSDFSAHKWLAAKLLFKEHGIDIDKDLKGYSHAECCEDIAFNIYINAVDAGMVCDHFFKKLPKREPPLNMDLTQFTVISTTKPVPTRIFASRRGLSDAVVEKVNRALLNLNIHKPDHAEILNSAELGGFTQAGKETLKALSMLNQNRLAFSD